MPSRMPISLHGAPRCLLGGAVTRTTRLALLAPSLFTPLLTPLLTPSLFPQPTSVRTASILASLAPKKGSILQRKRVGRGPASGYGKTSGRGHKGTGQRSKIKPWFQSGQTALIKVKGRKGEDVLTTLDLATVNLSRIQEWIDNGRLDPSKPITPKELIEVGLAKLKDGVKILTFSRDYTGGAASPLRQPITMAASRASQAAIAAVEAAGGRIITRYYTRLAIRRLLRGESVHSETALPLGLEHLPSALAAIRAPDGRRLYRLPDPTSRRDMEYYRDPAHRGYLSSRLAPGESPSLLHKVPLAITDEDQWRSIALSDRKQKKRQVKQGVDNDIF